MERKTISHICFSLLLSIIIMAITASVIGTMLTIFALYGLRLQSTDSFVNGVMLLATGIGLLILYFSFKQMTKEIFTLTPKKTKLPAKEVFLMGLSGFGLSIVFAYLGIGLNMGITFLITGKATSLSDAEIVSDTLGNAPLLPMILYVVIIGPFLEELIFRKTLISKLRPFGYKTSIIVSGVLFGAYHLNLEQFFYAAFIGILLGAVYYKSNNITYTYLIHVAFNLSSVLLTQLEPKFPVATVVVYYGLNLAGFVCFFVYGFKWIKRKPVETPYHISKRDTWGNPGMILYLVFAFIASIFTIFSTTLSF